MKVLTSDFYTSRPTLSLARDLLGCEIVHLNHEGLTAGIIVETEAYLCDDPACHSYNKKTLRNSPMFGPAGTLYIYFIYGMHFCANVVSAEEGVGEAVLLRALEPTRGADLMRLRRGLHARTLIRLERKRALTDFELCNGPGKLAQAMAFTPQLVGSSLVHGPVCIKPKRHGFEIAQTTRIGISQAMDMPYRFYILGNRYVSRQ